MWVRENWGADVSRRTAQVIAILVLAIIGVAVILTGFRP